MDLMKFKNTLTACVSNALSDASAEILGILLAESQKSYSAQITVKPTIRIAYNPSSLGIEVEVPVKQTQTSTFLADMQIDIDQEELPGLGGEK